MGLFVFIFIAISITTFSLPNIEKNIFEQMIMLNVTILGFTLLGIFYYLSKFEDFKKQQIDMAIETIKNAEINNMIKMGAKEVSINDFFEGYVKDINELFDLINDIIKYFSEFFVIYFGIAIIFSFCALLFIENNITKQSVAFFILDIMLILTTIHYFEKLWTSVKQWKKGADEITINHIRIMNENRFNQDVGH